MFSRAAPEPHDEVADEVEPIRNHPHEEGREHRGDGRPETPARTPPRARQGRVGTASNRGQERQRGDRPSDPADDHR